MSIGVDKLAAGEAVKPDHTGQNLSKKLNSQWGESLGQNF